MPTDLATFLARAEARYAAVLARQGTEQLCPQCLSGTGIWGAVNLPVGVLWCGDCHVDFVHIATLLADAHTALAWARSASGWVVPA